MAYAGSGIRVRRHAGYPAPVKRATPPSYLAVDIGAESGRAMVGTVSDTGITLDERHRFSNRQLQLPDRLAWDITGLFGAAIDGLAAAGPVRSIGIDAWAVDFGLLRRDGSLAALPRSYRDPMTAGILPELFNRVGSERLFQRTGIQMMEINTLCQLLAMRQAGLAELDEAARLLMIPDLLGNWLGAEPVAERSNATTTQFLGVDGGWASDILEACDIPIQLMQKVVDAGTVVGKIGNRVGEKAGAIGLPIVAVCSHDTASAILGTPLSRSGTPAFISSGTWSLVGVEIAEPILGEPARRHNLSNEGGYAGSTNLLRNVMGLWLVQGCRARWALQDGFATSYDDLMTLARQAPGFTAVIDPDDPRLLRPVDMPATISELCLQSGQTPPATRGQVLRVVLESLALRYRWALDALSAATGRPITSVHVSGGGSTNKLLCEMTAGVTGVRVTAGPVEATALGNVLVQAIADGQLKSVTEGRQLISSSFPVSAYDPAPGDRWEDAYGRFQALAAADPLDRVRALKPGL